MIYYETLVSDCGRFKIETQSDYTHLSIEDDAWTADNEAWISVLQESLSLGYLENEHVESLKEGLMENGIEPDTKNLLILNNLLTSAKERMWF